MISAPTASNRPAVGLRVLAGPRGYEPLAQHEKRLGPRPRGGSGFIEALRDSGLRGRGGAWFPTWRKWAAVNENSDGSAVVVVNGHEGEPLSGKDRVLLQMRPHLVIDGAMLAAESIRASDVTVYLSRSSEESYHAVQRALDERRDLDEQRVRVERTAHRYVGGESSAVVARASGGQSKPRFTLVRMAEKGVDDRPTLVQNAETMAHVALIARYGPAWFRRLGTAASPGTTLMTLTGNVRSPGVYEVDLAATIGAVVREVGGTTTPPAGALLGGYFGSWLGSDSLNVVPLDVDSLRTAHAAAFGCGILAILPQGGCGIVESTRILAYLAAESAGQCGPCINGLAALAETMQHVASSDAEFGDIDRVMRWIDMVKGRGACHHPDGAVSQLQSALTVFKEHLRTHLLGHPCYGVRTQGFPKPPAPGDGWK